MSELEEDFAPGSYGCHEALHAASMLAEMVDSHVAEHPAILRNPEWYQRARDAVRALFELYQMIGAAHLPMDATRKTDIDAVGGDSVNTGATKDA